MIRYPHLIFLKVGLPTSHVIIQVTFLYQLCVQVVNIKEDNHILCPFFFLLYFDTSVRAALFAVFKEISWEFVVISLQSVHSVETHIWGTLIWSGSWRWRKAASVHQKRCSYSAAVCESCTFTLRIGIQIFQVSFLEVRAEQLQPHNCNTQPNYPISINYPSKLHTAEHIQNSITKATTVCSQWHSQ